MAKYVEGVQVSFEKPQMLEVCVKQGSENIYTRDAAEAINTWFAGAIGSLAYNQAEFDYAVSSLQREISECDEFVRERLEIHYEDWEEDVE